MAALGPRGNPEATFDIFDDEKENRKVEQLNHLKNMLPPSRSPTIRHSTAKPSVHVLQSHFKEPSATPAAPELMWSYSDNTDTATHVIPQAVKGTSNPLNELLARLTESQSIQFAGSQPTNDGSSSTNDPCGEALPPKPAIDRPDAAEVVRLKKELEVANERMAQMDLQLNHERNERLALAEMDFNQSQIARQTVEAVIGSPFPVHRALPQASDSVSHAADLASAPSSGHYERNSHLVSFPINKDLKQDDMNDSLCASYHSQHSSPYEFNAFSGRSSLKDPFGISNLGLASFSQMDPAANVWRAQPHPSSKAPSIVPTYSGLDPWVSQAHLPVHTMNNIEPLNYRRLLDRNMSCDWKYIVDKIVCNNDQQASIFLQQKLKQGTAEQKYSIVQAIINQAYPLMVNRFGNFLVQRCFEHGAPDQVVAIAQAIRGNTLTLSMDAFGCHVVQKAFDCVPEEYKAMMVHELLRRIPETVIHRYACHVWQKLFELRWNDTPPQIMKYVNEALRGMWHEVALGETGSLVVQNIFENCLEDDKRPCITEVLASIDVVAHGQFGNWCIQHICEHGSAPDRSRAIDHVIRYAAEYSTDQFASKVVEKCLKVGGVEFLDRYLDRVCEARADRPRMPLIDVAGDQFGNYLIQYILTNADAQRREIVANHIRKHMVSLRGSKYGSRVAMLCCNPAYATRPGPPTGLLAVRYSGRYADSILENTHGRQFSGGGPFPRAGRGGFGGSCR